MGTFSIHYANSILCYEDVPLPRIAREYGTPLYVYSQGELLARVNECRQAADSGREPLICYAIKANGNPHLVRLFADAGLGADVTSGGEMHLALHAGISPNRIVFSGVGKTESEIESAVISGIMALHVESEMELNAVARITARLERKVNIAVRINPNVSAETHPHVSTGQQIHKFGVSVAQAVAMLHSADRNPWLRPVGIAAHIGSQVTDLTPFQKTVEILCALASDLDAQGIDVEYIDVGGGLGIDYTKNGAPSLTDWVRAVAAPVLAAGKRLVLEPGRSLIGPAGLLLTRVIYTKESGGKRFVIADAGMNDLIRPALYGAHHPIWPVIQEEDDQLEVVDVVGPVCETGDTLARTRALPPIRAGDLLAVMMAGAYGFAMSSNYNGRLRPAEVLVSGNQTRLIRRRQTYSDLLEGS